MLTIDGKEWFVAKEVCEILGYRDTDDATRRHCKYAKLLKPGDSPGLNLPPRGMMIIPESDLYRLVLRSKMPIAEAFQDWVTEEVLPEIRKIRGCKKKESPSPRH